VIDKHTVLKKIFGYNSFRPGQEDVVEQVIQGKDCLVIMPTGGGKSICYQVPALVLEGLAIVVSPLIALMNDQVIALNQLGVEAAAIHSNHSADELRAIIHDIESGKLKLLYVSPERLNNEQFQSFLQKQKISFIAIDEAHCVSVWGNDFRPDYAALSFLKKQFPDKNIVALTATADKATQDDIINQLSLQSPTVSLSSFERENITISVRSGLDRKKQILNFVNRRKGDSGIIYCLSRKSCEKVAADLKKAGIKAGFYHAGMTAENRRETQKQFQDDNLQIVCATIAFGMGIDKSNIKWVIHYNMPKNLEGYYQEIGRSGRDGTPATALLFYSWSDFLMYKKFIDEGEANEDFKYVQTAKLQRMWEYVSTSDCRTNLILNYFGEYKTEKCQHCDNCIRPPQKIDGKVNVQKAISAVIRSNQELPLNLLVDVLRGSYRQEVQAGGYQNIKTFGVGRDLSFIEWKDYITQMIDKGLLRIDYTDRLRLKVTPLSKPAILGPEPIMLKAFEKSDDVPATSRKKEKRKTANELIETELVDELKSWRLKKAQGMNVPAYVVLTDKSINEIASAKPTTSFALEEVEGIGQKRMENYGDELLEVIQDYLRTQQHKKTLKGKTYLETMHLYKTGKTPQQIGDERGINIVTVYSHFAHLYSQGEPIDLWKYVTREEVDLVKSAYIASGKKDELNTINQYLKGKVEFHKLRMAMALVKKED